MDRIKRGLRFNKPQIISASWMSVACVLAVAIRVDLAPWWGYVLAGVTVPLLITVMNIWHPLPESSF